VFGCGFGLSTGPGASKKTQFYFRKVPAQQSDALNGTTCYAAL
jgi:hypothetical protein